MGVCFRAEGLPPEKSYDGGYIAYGAYRMKLAEAIDPQLGTLCYVWATNLGERRLGGRPHLANVLFLKEPGSVAELVDAGLLRVESVTGGPSSPLFRGDYCLHVLLDKQRFMEWAGEHVSLPARTFLLAPDTSGEWSWEECRDMHAELAGYSVGAAGRNCAQMDSAEFDMHERFMSMMRHCWERRTSLVWG